MFSLEKQLQTLSEHYPTWSGQMFIRPELLLLKEHLSRWDLHLKATRKCFSIILSVIVLRRCKTVRFRELVWWGCVASRLFPFPSTLSKNSDVTFIHRIPCLSKLSGISLKSKRTDWPARWITPRWPWTSPAQTPSSASRSWLWGWWPTNWKTPTTAMISTSRTRVSYCHADTCDNVHMVFLFLSLGRKCIFSLAIPALLGQVNATACHSCW